MVDTDRIADEPSMWVPMTNPVDLAHIGKLGEEASELAAVCARITIQGIDGVDPGTGKTNLQALMDEIADVRAMSELAMEKFSLDRPAIAVREVKKMHHKRLWHKRLQEMMDD